jgi:uncharacterized protein YifE (UPF0438 family)
MINKILKFSGSSGHSYGHYAQKAYLNATVYNIVREEDYDNCYKAIENNIYTPVAKDKLYFYPNCTVPRFKIREFWGKNKKVAVTIKETKATHFFLSHKKEVYVNNDGGNYEVDAKVFKKWLEDNKSKFEKNNLEDFLIDNFDENIKQLLDSSEKIWTSWAVIRMMEDSSITLTSEVNGAYNSFNLHTYESINNEKFLRTTVAGLSFKDDRVLQVFTDIHNGNTSNYFLDSAVNDALMDDSTVINDDMYDQLKNLLNSDDSNITMAMEIIANSNVKKSAKYIYKLFREFNQTFRYSSCYNSVNFKALVDTVGINRYYSFTDDNYLKFLHKFDAIDYSIVNELRKNALEIALTAVESSYRNTLNKDIFTVEIPYIKVTVKGLNDGTNTIAIEDSTIKEIEDTISENIQDYTDMEAPVAPCVAHDQATVEALNSEDMEPVLTEEKQILESITSEEEAKQMAEAYLEDVADGEYPEEVDQAIIEQVEMQTKEVIEEEINDWSVSKAKEVEHPQQIEELEDITIMDVDPMPDNEVTEKSVVICRNKLVGRRRNK